MEDLDFPWPIGSMVREHHERVDGSGYPFGLTGEEIALEARIIAVADTVEVIASHRPYQRARSIDTAMEIIGAERGLLFDPEVVDACRSLFRDGFSLPQQD